MALLTVRQYVALRLWYVEGWSQRRIGRDMKVTHQAVYTLIVRGRKALVRGLAEQGVATLPLVEGLLRPSATSSVTRDVGQAASRREELLDALQLRMEQRATELAIVEECMSGDSFSPTRTKRNPYDQWETRYLSRHEAEPLPTNAYDAGRAAANCACEDPGCDLGCAGCRHALRK